MRRSTTSCTSRVLARPARQLIVGARREHHRQSRHVAKSFLAETESYWHNWCATSTSRSTGSRRDPRGDTLKMCSYEDTGAVGGVTTRCRKRPNTAPLGLPLNWLRDAFFTVTALNRLSATRTWKATCASSSTWSRRQLARRGRRHRAAVPDRAGTDTTEALTTLAWLSRLRPVRVGNAASPRVRTTPTARWC